MKRILFKVLIISTIVGNQTQLPTMTILKVEPSEILSDYEGKKPSFPSSTSSYYFELIPIVDNPNSFIVWSGPYEVNQKTRQIHSKK